MFAAQKGFPRVARILLNRGASASRAADDGCSALHLSAENGHLAVTVDLVKAGASLNARCDDGSAPLHLAAQSRHREVTVALIVAGADVDSRGKSGATSLFTAAARRYADIARELLRARANPLLSAKSSAGLTFSPLNVAAEHGHSEVVRELIQQCGIKGCIDASGGVDALCGAAKNQRVEAMGLLTDAGVVDTGEALVHAARWGGEAAVKFLLQQRQLVDSPTGLVVYVNFRDSGGCTALFTSIASNVDARGKP